MLQVHDELAFSVESKDHARELRGYHGTTPCRYKSPTNATWTTVQAGVRVRRLTNPISCLILSDTESYSMELYCYRAEVLQPRPSLTKMALSLNVRLSFDVVPNKMNEERLVWIDSTHRICTQWSGDQAFVIDDFKLLGQARVFFWRRFSILSNQALPVGTRSD